VTDNISNNQKLKKLMRHHRLGRRDVARLLGYRINSNGQAYTVVSWLQEPGSSAFRPMNDRAMENLMFRLSKLTNADRQKFEGPTDKVAVIAENRKKRKYLLEKGKA
jgi:hypothetical protein